MWKKVIEVCKRKLVACDNRLMHEAPAMFKRSKRGNTNLKEVDGIWVEKCGWGRMWFCSSVRSTLFLVPNPQEDKKNNGKKNRL